MKTSLSYIAGYIDGDGCFFLNKENNPLKYRAKIIISSTCKFVLVTFANEFGGNVYIQSKRKDHWKRTYHWILQGKYAFKFSLEILDFLIEKKEDAKIFIEYIQSNKLLREELINIMRNKRESIREIDECVVDKIRNVKIKGVSNDLDFPYFAGFIDAECCLGISKYKPKNRPNFTYKISLQCTNTNPIIFFWLRERFGGSITHVKRKQKNPKHRDQIIWVLNGDRLAKILPKILPYLRAKNKVCEKLIELHNTVLPNGGDRQSEEFRNSYSAILCLREQIVNEVHKLNSKGSNV